MQLSAYDLSRFRRPNKLYCRFSPLPLPIPITVVLSANHVPPSEKLPFQESFRLRIDTLSSYRDRLNSEDSPFLISV